MIALERLTAVLESFPRLTIGLIGDLFLDRYLEIDSEIQEYSIETGLEAFQVTRIRNCPGALGTVMNNLAALGVGRMKPITVIGDDGHGYDLVRALETLPVDTASIVRCPERLTPTYTKPIRRDAQGQWQELNRLDVRTRAPLADPTRRALIRHLEAAFPHCDGWIVLDQIEADGEGVVDAEVRARLEQLATTYPDKLVYVDSRRFLGRYRFGTLKGNESEILAAGGHEGGTADAALRLADRTSRPVFCTVGDRGILVARPDGGIAHVPAFPVRGPIDIVGAGDSATAGIVMSLLAGADELEAAMVGNLVASITVTQLGTTGTATPQQILDRWHEANAK